MVGEKRGTMRGVVLVVVALALLACAGLTNGIPTRPGVVSSDEETLIFEEEFSMEIEKKKPASCDALKKKACEKTKGCDWCGGKWFAKCFSTSEASKLTPGSGMECSGKSDKNTTKGCEDYMKPGECNDDDKCSWCMNEWFAKCYNKTQAEGLPPAFFKCHNDTPPATCSDITGPAHCNQNKSCSWCSGSGVKAECFSHKVAEDLPTEFYNCSGVKPKPPPPPPPVHCDKLPQKDCAVEPTCEWCSGDLIIPKCFNASTAKKLPSDFFHCKPGKAPRPDADEARDKEKMEALLIKVAKDTEADVKALSAGGLQSECVKELEAGCKASAKCEWCSMEYYAMCFSKPIADQLPAFIFNCSSASGPDANFEH